MMETLLVVAVGLLVIAAGAAGWALMRSRSLQAQRDALQTERDAAQQQATSLQVELGEMRMATAKLERDLAVSEEKLRGQQEQLGAMNERFKALAGDALKQANEQFLQLAKQTFASEQKQSTAELEQRKQAIDAMLRPIRETLDKHAKAVTDIEKSREGAYHALRQQLTTLVEDQKTLRGETQNLVQALRRPEVRGRWGEMQLRRVAELAGMIDHVDFTEQTSTDTGDGRLRPDMVVHLPAGRTIVVDAKTPISAFIEAIECQDDESRETCLRRHVKHIEEQVGKLAAKGYSDQFDRSPDFVVLFIPGESFLEAAVRLQPQLIERAMNRNVVIATPTTLISLLKAVEMGWREQRVADSAARVSDLGRELHSRIGTLLGHIDKLGKAMETSVKHYNAMVGSLESNVLPQARRFKELGADSPKELPAEGQVKRIEGTPREVTA